VRQRFLGVDSGGVALAHVSKVNGSAFTTGGTQFGVSVNQVLQATVNPALAQLGVNVVNVGASAIQQAGGFLKVSAGTGAGQLNLSKGRIGVNWGDVANPTTAVGLSGTTIGGSTATDALAAAIKLKTDLIPATPAFGVQKGGTFGPWPIIMRQLIDPTQPAPGLTVTAEVMLDGGVFAACVNSVAEVSGGVYKHTLAAADLNANKSVCVKYTAPGAVTEFLTLLITP